MIDVKGFMRQQGLRLLENSRYALMCAVFLATIPFTTWLSQAVIALVVLKKGWRDGLMLLMPVMTAFLACSLFSVSVFSAVVNTLLTFIPLFLAACILGMTASWRAVATGFFLFASLSAVLLQIFMPEFIMAQYRYVLSAMQEIQPGVLSKLVNNTGSLNQHILANYLFGIQLAGLVFSTSISLTMARSVQSQLFYPGGYRKEMLSLRGSKAGLAMLVLMLIAAQQGKFLAMNMLPLLVMYFLAAGLSLGAHVLDGKKVRGAMLLLVIPLLFMPFVMLPFYVILGSLDSVFNLRLYLPVTAGKTT